MPCGSHRTLGGGLCRWAGGGAGGGVGGGGGGGWGGDGVGGAVAGGGAGGRPGSACSGRDCRGAIEAPLSPFCATLHDDSGTTPGRTNREECIRIPSHTQLRIKQVKIECLKSTSYNLERSNPHYSN